MREKQRELHPLFVSVSTSTCAYSSECSGKTLAWSGTASRGRCLELDLFRFFSMALFVPMMISRTTCVMISDFGSRVNTFCRPRKTPSQNRTSTHLLEFISIKDDTTLSGTQGDGAVASANRQPYMSLGKLKAQLCIRAADLLEIIWQIESCDLIRQIDNRHQETNLHVPSLNCVSPSI